MCVHPAVSLFQAPIGRLRNPLSSFGRLFILFLQWYFICSNGMDSVMFTPIELHSYGSRFDQFLVYFTKINLFPKVHISRIFTRCRRQIWWYLKATHAFNVYTGVHYPSGGSGHKGAGEEFFFLCMLVKCLLVYLSHALLWMGTCAKLESFVIKRLLSVCTLLIPFKCFCRFMNSSTVASLTFRVMFFRYLMTLERTSTWKRK